jgi:hypothetical protein
VAAKAKVNCGFDPFMSLVIDECVKMATHGQQNNIGIEYHVSGLGVIRNNGYSPGCQWFIAVILATQEVEIRRIAFRNQPGQIVLETLSPK